MTFLEICRRVAKECGMTASALIPTSVMSQAGNLLDAVQWSGDAWNELQLSRSYWRWMRSRFTINTVVDQDSYVWGSCTDEIAAAPITRFAEWLFLDGDSPPTFYLTSGGTSGRQFLTYIPWDCFRTIYRVGTLNAGSPCHITVDPQDNIVLGPMPDAIYTLQGEYQKSPQTLAANDDVPEMPLRFHMLIVYEAMRKYAGYESAPEVMQRATLEGGPIRSQLIISQLPQFRRGRPLV